MDWSYESWPSGEPYEWAGAARGHTVYDAADYHVDLGCGTIKKGRIGIDRYPAPGVNIVMDLDEMEIFGMAPAPGCDAVDQWLHEDGPHAGEPTGAFRVHTPGGPESHWDYHSPDSELRAYHFNRLPFRTGEINSIISHHALEHVGAGFIRLVDEIYRVLKPGGIFYAITPLFPSHTAVADADHKRYFMDTTWDAFCGHLGDESNPSGSWLDSFSVPYTQARFEKLHQDMSPPTPPEKQWTKDDAREMRVALRAVK